MSKDNTPFHLRNVSQDRPVLPEVMAHEDPNSEPFGTWETEPIMDYSEYSASGKGLLSRARVTEDGRITVSLDLKKTLPDLPPDYAPNVKEFAIDEQRFREVPSLNIVVMIVGSRGDVQPYVALGKELARDGHRVRLATHEVFCDFVRDEGLEFFNIGGNPQQLMSYMVKNPGLIPGFESLTNGDIGRKKQMVKEMLDGCWRACVEKDTVTGKPFAADAIISNPPSFAHIHCAEALGIPLQLSFTMPWSPTTQFPHPLVNISSSNAESGLSNYLSYTLADLLTWQGLGDIVNHFRVKTLGLEPFSLRIGAGVLDRVKAPWTYCMSPSLVPKPADWKNHIDIVGFYFLEHEENYQPPQELADFLAAGDTPIYIGFGSVVIDDPTQMTKTIFEAVEKAGVRALVSAGWGGLGGVDIPSSVYILDKPVPHDWLFSRVFAVCHHGGAGTTAIGLKLGKPTIVVPFFGDQPWWGRQIATKGAGPEPIHHKLLTADNLSDAIKFTQTPGALSSAETIGRSICDEDGVKQGVQSFYRHLPLLNMRCDLDSNRVAVWWSTEHCLKLSAFAAQTLADAKLLDMNTLDLHRPKEYDTKKHISDPITGGGSAIFWTVTNYYGGIAKIFYKPVQGIIDTTVAIPKGIFGIISNVYDGFHNVPKMYGSEVREPGKVKGFKSGLEEAGKGFYYGFYDGITGLVKEPVSGMKKEGFIGGIKGSLRSYANVSMRPAAGSLGLVVHPVAGAWKSLQNKWAKKKVEEHRLTRIQDGLESFRAAPSKGLEKETIIKKFKEAKEGTGERKDRYKKLAEDVIKNENEEVRREGLGEEAREEEDEDDITISPMPGPSAPATAATPGAGPGPAAAPPPPPYNPTQTQPEIRIQTPPQTMLDDEESFNRDMEAAMKASMEESQSKQSAPDPAHAEDVDLDATFEKDLEEARKLSLMDK